MKNKVEVGKLKEGGYVMIEDEPCRIVSSEHSKPGKHGGAKCRVTGMGVFDGRKREFVCPAGNAVEVPVVERKRGQVLAILRAGDKERIQLMDLGTYENFELEKPDFEISEGMEVSYIEFEGRRKIIQ